MRKTLGAGEGEMVVMKAGVADEGEAASRRSPRGSGSQGEGNKKNFISHSSKGIGMADKKWRKLTPEEEEVIVDRGTERPFSGEYEGNRGRGLMSAGGAGASLYKSEDKFDARCGWPSFDDEIKGAVKRIPDPDGMRTEIECANCGAHFGHVFEGEGLTIKNVRHCVNSISMMFIPEKGKAVKNGK